MGLRAVVLEIVHSAQLAIGSADADDAGEETGTEAPNLNAIGDENTSGRMNEPAKLRLAQRSLRQSGLKRVAEFFRLSTTAIDYAPYVRLAFPPSEDRIIAENVRAPSVRILLQERTTMFERIVKTGFEAEPITQRMIDVLSSLSNFMTEPEDAARLTHPNRHESSPRELRRTCFTSCSARAHWYLSAVMPAAMRTPGALIHSPGPYGLDLLAWNLFPPSRAWEWQMRLLHHSVN